MTYNNDNEIKPYIMRELILDEWDDPPTQEELESMINDFRGRQ